MEEHKRVDDMSLTEKVSAIAKEMRLDEHLAKEKKKQKKFKFFPKLKKGKLKKNYAIIMLIRTNGYVDLMKLPIEDDFVYIKKIDMRYAITANCVLRWNNLPLIIIQEWSLEPVSPEMLQRKTFEDSMTAYPQKILINAIKKGQIQQKKMGGNLLLWIILGAAVLFILAAIFKVKIW